MEIQHNYKVAVKWTGNKGEGTANYKAYLRDYLICIENKATILGSSDPAFRGNDTMYNPEELLVASLSSCHMLWYLHLCAEAGVVVIDYIDNAIGTMVEMANGGGQFKEVTLYPTIVVSDKAMIGKATELHKKANELCFIAKSVNFIVSHQSSVLVKG